MQCTVNDSSITIVKSKGLDAENLTLNSLIFCNKDTGFIVGSSDSVVTNSNKNSSQFAFVKREALLYRTINGGKKWEVRSFGEGYLKKIKCIDGKIFLFRESENYSKLTIFSSMDFGNSWQEEILFPDRIYDILSNEKKYVAACADENGSQIYSSNNEGKSWSKIVTGRDVLNFLLVDSMLYYISSNTIGGNERNKFVNFNFTDSTNSVIDLPKGFKCYLLSNSNGTIRLAGIQNNEIVVYVFQKKLIKHVYTYKNNESYFLQGYYSFNHDDFLVLGKRNKSDVTNLILQTKNSGKTWERINFTKPNYIKPFFFLNTDNSVSAWFYSGSGVFQFFSSPVVLSMLNK